MPARALPTGTVTFVFTDIEGSTRLVQSLGETWSGVLEQHNEILGAAITEHEGEVIRTEGDAFFAVFPVASDAMAATVEIQRRLAEHEWPSGSPIAVRIGMHTGTGVLGGDDYVGIDVHRAARIAATGHGGQIVCSETTASLIEHTLPEGVVLRDLGKHRLKDLSDREAIFQIVIVGLSDEFPPLDTLERITHNLPLQTTSFVGREAEIAEAVDRLRSTHILTLLGPGGTGKSRLSLQVAAECAEHFPDGTFFVPLAPVTDPELVPSTILGVLGVPASTRRQRPREHLIDFFAGRSSLLVLDNFEQVVDAGDVVAELVKRSPQSRVLVTSRVPLRISGEQEMPIRPLDVGARSFDPEVVASIPAVRLFLDRLLAVRPDFELTSENAEDVVELVRRLDGLPLAIELVVSQLRMLPVKAVLERLDPSRLGGAVRDAPERHQTLWNAIEWSVESLSSEQRDLLARLSVFAGGARLQEVEAVCADVELDLVDGLGALIERSLLAPGDTEDDVRFGWLRVIREYASEMLDESGDRADTERRHAEAYLVLAEEAFGEMLGRERHRWIETLHRDHDNLRAAVSWAIEHQRTDMALRFGWALWRYWQTRGHIHEARGVMERIVRMDGGESALRAKAIEAMGGIAWWGGEMDEAHRLYHEALDLQRQLGEPSEIANALYNTGLVLAYGMNDPEAARRDFQEAESIYADLGDIGGLANVHWGVGSLAYLGAEEPAVSRAMLEQSVDEYRAAGNVFGEGWAHFELAALLLRTDDVDPAEGHLIDGLRLLWEARDYSAVVMFVMLFAWAARQRGEDERAVKLAGAGYALRDQTGVDIMSIQVNQQEGMTESDMESLEGELRTAYLEGRSLGFDEAVSYAIGE